MKIYLDDVRETPPDWYRCYTIEEVKKLLCDALLGYRTISDMSLDHDLGAAYTDPLNAPTGYDLVKWMAQHDMWPTNKPTVHSANPVGKANMLSVIDQHWTAPYVRK